MNQAAASLDPSTFGHVAPEDPIGKLNVSQINRPLAIRKTASLHVACECGRPLCGLEEEWIFDPLGCALHITGVCLKCGVQKVMYLSEPKVVPTSQAELRLQRLKADVARVLEQIAALECGGADNEPLATAEDDEEAA